MTRIYGKVVSLDKDEVLCFFEGRGRGINPDHPVTSVLYQDKNPELAEMRDAHEKTRVLPMLGLSRADRVLDLGCGIGRWADAIHPHVHAYHGVDFSASLIAAARARNAAPNATFQELRADDVTRETLSVSSDFTLVLIAGLMIYLNDDQLERALRGAAACCAEQARVYVREPVANTERLTLQAHPSEELDSVYHAVYRTEAELLRLVSDTLLSAGFRVMLNEALYPDNLNNRAETTQRIFLFERP